MFRIRRVHDDVLPVNQEVLRQVRDILKGRFPEASPAEIDALGEKLRNPFKQRFRCVLFVAESLEARLQGFALLLHEPEIGFGYLDWIALNEGLTGGGIGGALYERVRRECLVLRIKGLFFECLPDDESACPNPELLPENRARLQFYERYGARPVAGTDYESPVSPGDTCMPHLVYDGLLENRKLRRAFARRVVRAILERKYADLCPPDYVKRVVASFREDPVRLRDFRYVRPQGVLNLTGAEPLEPIPVLVNDRHQIHHIHERGYVESPVRVRRILESLDRSGLFENPPVRQFPDKHILAVHDAELVEYLRRACEEVPENKSLYPYVFPIRNKARLPLEPSVLSGYYCIDTFTPIHRNAYPAARRAVDCALSAAAEILEGKRLAYALIRPPGHHAEYRAFGGFCYFNNNAIAAHYLAAWGRVAILDIDYHHGNGQQNIFYQRSDVLTVSIHGHPSFAYPYFSGFEDEQGEAEGEGFNLNIPLPEAVDGETYRRALGRALRRITDFSPQFLVVALGLDTARRDPTGTWSLTMRDFEENGRIIGGMGLPTVVIQEGGYRTRTLGGNALAFFRGLAGASRKWSDIRHPPAPTVQDIVFREEVTERDEERVRRMTAATGFFRDEEVAVAGELVEERRQKGAASGYEFVMAEQYGRLVGYACFGGIPLTRSSYDLYWIVVQPDFQGRGLGRTILMEAERRIKADGGTRVYVDTSQRAQYASTRAFYESMGYQLETVLADFYEPGDGKAIYRKVLG